MLSQYSVTRSVVTKVTKVTRSVVTKVTKATRSVVTYNNTVTKSNTLFTYLSMISKCPHKSIFNQKYRLDTRVVNI